MRSDLRNSCQWPPSSLLKLATPVCWGWICRFIWWESFWRLLKHSFGQSAVMHGEAQYVTDAATGSVRMVTPLGGTVTFLRNLGLLFWLVWSAPEGSEAISCVCSRCSLHPEQHFAKIAPRRFNKLPRRTVKPMALKEPFHTRHRPPLLWCWMDLQSWKAYFMTSIQLLAKRRFFTLAWQVLWRTFMLLPKWNTLRTPTWLLVVSYTDYRLTLCRLVFGGCSILSVHPEPHWKQLIAVRKCCIDLCELFW